MSHERHAHWIEKVAEELEARCESPLTFSTAKTPSGPIHVGVGRELIYCHVFSKILEKRGRRTRFLFFIDDFDSLKSFPPSIPESFAAHKEYLGRPMFALPCPYGHCESWAAHYANEFIETFRDFGLSPELHWSHRLYSEKPMKNAIRLALEKREEIRRILLEVTGPTLSPTQLEAFTRDLQDWYPCLVVCERCGRLKDGRVTGYNPSDDTVSYSCEACGHAGEVSMEDWPIKLRWRVDWPAKWAIFKVGCEPAGKDHCVKGGAYDTGLEICRRVFGWTGPYRIPYEWILLGKKAMKTHKGVSFTFREWLSVAPPEIYRFMILREDPKKHITFLPERIPQLMDEFERFEAVYFGLEEPASEAEAQNAKVVYPHCMVGETPKAPTAKLPYRFAVVLTQLEELLGRKRVLTKAYEVAARMRGRGPEILDEQEMHEIARTLERAKYWVNYYAPEEIRFNIQEKLNGEIKRKLSEKHREAFRELHRMLAARRWGEQELQYEIFELGKRLGLGSKIFEGLYLVFLGRNFGPRLAPFLLSLERDFVMRRLQEAYG